ncbi:beta-galactosidase [Kaistia dalseonensis]|uniref:Beta-galactosidase n=1 Tax=Kaistia dalseonensis TaxID=410840 RepID=A0ABU0H0U9_9HYPH|nr:beta-galactosidase [Kaistia dalseonensis]MCX5493379.1 beta-galactosidase [Kaistia dalseonensis]MDQ0435937.1 beta-galactosidase [Kaistia dalseonensis]
MTTGPALGVCYYPEHWPEARWAEDAAAMREFGIRYVRIGEFAWGRMEPEPGIHDWSWLDRAIRTLAEAGLDIVLGTPTASPPKWLVDRHPDILPHDEKGHVRGFGSRRHYTASSDTYWRESARIVESMAARYGDHPKVVGWQIDNEFGDNDSILSYGPEDIAGFRRWLRGRYQTPEALNEAWSNVFWSMEVSSFDDVGAPVGTVGEANPSARLDYRRYFSDRFAEYCAMQAAIIRRLSPGRFVTHNFMSLFHDFDHFKMAESLDFASWDSYPLGKVESFPFSDDERIRWARTSHPDMSALHHDLFRGMAGNSFWVMEQQPGPVNWGKWNPAPAPGMVRLWSWEAFAHGAETVSYFRWRQFGVAQEQMHSGLHRPDGQISPGGREARRVAQEIADFCALPASQQAKVAIVFDYEASWILKIQPQGQDFNYSVLVHNWYEALRRCGVDIDFVAPGASLAGYALVIVPTLPHVSPAALAAFQAFDGIILFGPRSGSKTRHYAIPENQPPGPLQELIALKVAEVSSLRPGLAFGLSGAVSGTGGRWIETIETALAPAAVDDAGEPVLVRDGRRLYLGAWIEGETLRRFARSLLVEAGLDVIDLPDHIRLRRRGDLVFAFNYGTEPWPIPAAGPALRIGAAEIPPRDLACWTDQLS